MYENGKKTLRVKHTKKATHTISWNRKSEHNSYVTIAASRKIMKYGLRYISKNTHILLLYYIIILYYVSYTRNFIIIRCIKIIIIYSSEKLFPKLLWKISNDKRVPHTPDISKSDENSTYIKLTHVKDLSLSLKGLVSSWRKKN